MQELFLNSEASVQSDRILYTPSLFARSALLNLQEVGSLKARSPHTSTRSGLTSYLYFLVLDGEGSLTYEGRQYQLKQGDCVFIDCQKPYSHSTSENLWSLAWCHFYGTSMTAIYEKYKEAFAKDPVISDDIVEKIHEGVELSEIETLISEDHAEPLYFEHQLVGCVKPAHDIDVNLSSHVMHENLMSKASSVLALLYAVKNAGIEKSDVEYVIDCAEEACGDMNQRGGGNFAKAAAEVAGLVNATGSDARGFCAAPTHALIEAAALVKAGAYKTVVVTAGGCTAKLGMNGKDHVKKGLPILEDCLGGFAVVVSENDGVNPEIDLGMLGRHSVGTGSAPQNVIGSLVADPLDRAGMKITDIDKFSPEMQNPDITKPAGAGDVPLANYKMIGALAVKRGELDRKELANFTKEHGLTGWAPTQGHIPSGVPYVGFAREDILDGKIKNAMIIGKGSLFLGRMTNLFDGVSFVIHGNTAAVQEEAAGVSEEEVKGLIAKAMKEFAATLMAE